MGKKRNENEVLVTKVVRGYELTEDLATSAERLIKAVTKSESGVRDLARELFTIQDSKLLKDTEWSGIGEFFETMTGLSASSASQYLRTFKAFKNEENDKWCKYSALVPFSMLTEISKLFGIVKKTIEVDGKVETGNASACGDELLTAFTSIAINYDDVYKAVKDFDDTVSATLEYVSKNWTNKQVRECIEDCDIVSEFEKEKEKKKKANTKSGSSNEDSEDDEDNVINEISDLIVEFGTTKMTKKAFLAKAVEILSTVTVVSFDDLAN